MTGSDTVRRDFALNVFSQTHRHLGIYLKAASVSYNHKCEPRVWHAVRLTTILDLTPTVVDRAVSPLTLTTPLPVAATSCAYFGLVERLCKGLLVASEANLLLYFLQISAVTNNSSFKVSLMHS